MSAIQRFTAALGASLLVAATADPAFAHHPGGPGNTGGSGPINTISATTLLQGMTVVSVTYERIGLDPLSDQELKEGALEAHSGGGHGHVHSLDSISSPALNAAYGLTNDLTVSLRLPYVIRTGIREGDVHSIGHGHGHEHEAEVENLGDADGIGDLSALGQWRFLNGKASAFEAALLAGIKAPTGDTSEKTRDGETFDAEFQPGSGSWDGIFGLALTHRAGAWSFDGSVLYTVVGEGTQNTDLGDRVGYGVAVSYRVFALGGPVPMFHGATSHEAGDEGHKHKHAGSPADPHHEEVPSGPALDLVLELNGEWSDKQKEGGETDVNSGGHTLYVAPGLRLSQDKWSAYASVGIPVVNDLNGIQAEPDWRLTSGLSVGF